MTSSDLSELLGLQPTGQIHWGLRRTRAMLHGVGRPHMTYRSVHIGGTNGKGSVAAMVASILSAAGQRVGLYTSPHLVEFAERIQVDGRPVDEELLGACARRLRPLMKEGTTFFETATALALLCFAEAEVDFAVAEVGLGGRLDATNVLLPEVAAVTNVAWDHSEYLGNTLSAIAGEKVGIAKPGVPLVLGRLEPEAGRIIRQTAERVGAPLSQIGYDAGVRRIRIHRDHTDLEYVGPDSDEAISLRCPLVGYHQAWNVGLAALAVQNLPRPWRPAPAALQQGIADVRWPGRLQIEERGDRTWVLDVAHNVVGVEALAQALTSLDLRGPLALVVAILGDKPWPEMLPPLLALADVSIFTVAPSSPPERRWNAEAVAATISSYSVEVIEDFGAALQHASQVASTIVVTGSNHTVGDAMRELGMPVSLLDTNTVG
ncbi:MAG: bifunctional folylpolyglutamate synthase/dihydrofolate synthase [Gemmatimonadetes bacterium]|nr:bifunctional folylpolyglutamate synthase/dihydrofolate synthase [Gemmatimonadota bacterium]NIO30700.1 bifunctional folylpolyglutamate synthase/dihydrofolate synthase [Gemmatimonadota bacterium]